MTRTKIKICGITNADDAHLAHSLGADYLGMIFTESPRRVTPETAAEVRDAVPEAMYVGVFQDAPIDEVIRCSEIAGVNFIQLHGDESPEYCEELQRKTGTPIIKAFRASGIPDTDLLASYSTTSFFLFDLDKDLLSDNTLRDRMDKMWKDVSRTRRQGFRVFLAGALTEHNVREAIQKTKAYCVDVCRGVEIEPGLKDPGAMERFIREARS